MSTIDPKVLASYFTPQQRQYIDAYVTDAVLRLTRPVLDANDKLTSQYKAALSEIEDLKARVDTYESKFRDDSKYALTRPKIIALMKAEGIYDGD